MFIKAINASLVCVFLTFSISNASDYYDGVTAYEKGDYSTAIKKWKPLAEQGNADVQNKVGDMYESGEGTVHNYTEAVRFYELSARQGNARGMLRLAAMYQMGKGLEKDKIYAYMWYSLGIQASGNSVAEFFIEELSQKMTTKELRIAQELSQKCLDSDYKKCESALPNFLHRKLNLSSEDKD